MELYRQLSRHGADGAFAQVIPRFDLSAPQRITKGGFFDRETFATGKLLGYLQTRPAHPLIDREALASMPGDFDEGFVLTGGGDVELFATIIERSFRFTAVESALVYEDLPRARTTPKGMPDRSFRNGINIRRIQCRGFSRSHCLSYTLRSLHELITLGLRGLLLFHFPKTRGFS